MTTNTITMTGNATGYGLFSGTEIFNLSGYQNTVLLNGAEDSVAVAGGGQDVIDLNASGFAHAVTDTIDLGASTFDTIADSNALYGGTLAITGAGGLANIDLTNHWGATSVTLGYTGNANAQYAAGQINSVTLNGDADNAVTYTAGGFSETSIGTAGDSFFGYQSSVSLYGTGNALQGGDEAFTVTDSTGWGNSVALGNGANAVSLSGGANTVALGNGANELSMTGYGNTAALGTGNNTVNLTFGSDTLSFGAGGAGAQDNLALHNSAVHIAAGDENLSVTADRAILIGQLGNGTNRVQLGDGRAHLTFGTGTDNTSLDSFATTRGGNWLTFNGGYDLVTLADQTGSKGGDTVTLNGTMLGTKLTAAGMLDHVTLTQDANAIIDDASSNGALHMTLDADSAGGFGKITIQGLGADTLAHIDLVGASPYTITADHTPVGGITLHFTHGSVDLVGLQSVPNNLFG